MNFRVGEISGKSLDCLSQNGILRKAIFLGDTLELSFGSLCFLLGLPSAALVSLALKVQLSLRGFEMFVNAQGNKWTADFPR